MDNLTYYVSVENKLSGISIISKRLYSESESIKQAKKWVNEYPEQNVYIEFFRKQDFQTGFVNRDGISLVGNSWTLNDN